MRFKENGHLIRYVIRCIPENMSSQERTPNFMIRETVQFKDAEFYDQGNCSVQCSKSSYRHNCESVINFLLLPDSGRKLFNLLYL